MLRVYGNIGIFKIVFFKFTGTERINKILFPSDWVDFAIQFCYLSTMRLELTKKLDQRKNQFGLDG